MKKHLFSFLFIIYSLYASAEKVQVNGLWFELDITWKTAAVASPKYSSEYSGNIIIPRTINYQNVDYSVTSINSYAFNGCSNLTSVIIPGSVKEIFDFAFRDCSSLESVVMEEGLKMIYENVFYQCYQLVSISFPSTLEYMGFNSSLNSTQWYSNQTGDVVYAGPICFCYKGNSFSDFEIAIKEGTKGIAAGAFRNCYGLTSITFPEGLTTIAEWAFSGCSKLKSVTFPESIRDIWQKAFDNTAWYTNQPDGLVYAGPVLYSYKGTMPENTTINIPEGTKGIAQKAFYGCENLSSVTIPNSVETIGWSVLGNCTGLVSIEFPNSIHTIPAFACNGCSNLKYVTIPKSITKVCGYSLAECSSLSDVICYAENVPCANSVTFTLNNISNANLHVPSSSLESYRATEPWSYFGSIIAIEEPVLEQCATPTISFSNGKVKFSCETEDVEFVSKVIVENSETDNIGSEIEIGTTFTVCVYARRNGYLDSDNATSSFSLSQMGDVNGDGQVSIADVTSLVNAILGK